MRRLLLALALFLLLAAGVSAQAADNVSVELQTRNEFPRALIFELSATGDVELTSARLFFRPAGTSYWSSEPVEITPGTSITAEYEWFTENQVLPPNLLLEYRWELETAGGETIKSDLQQVEFTDTRFEWQRLTSDKLTLLWYEGDQSWGEEMFSTAQQAMAEIQNDLGVNLEEPVRIVVYGNKSDFQGAFPPQQSWIGGQAFPDMSITVQIIGPGEDGWMHNVIPHEISHLVFHHATDDALANPPSWFDEGLAQYHEPGEFDQLDRLKSAAQRGELLPLSRLQGNFGADHGAVSLAYTESWAMVEYLISDCGKDGLHTIIEQLNEDRSVDEALETACGYDEQGLYNQWLEQQLDVSAAQSEQPADTESQPADEPEPTTGQQQPSSTTSFGGMRVYLILGVVALGAGLVALVAGGLAVALALKR